MTDSTEKPRFTLKTPLTGDDIYKITQAFRGTDILDESDQNRLHIYQNFNEEGEACCYFTLIPPDQDIPPDGDDDDEAMSKCLMAQGKQLYTIQRGDTGDDELVTALLRLPPKPPFDSFKTEISEAFHLPELEERHYWMRDKQDDRKAAQDRAVAEANEQYCEFDFNSELPIDPVKTKIVVQHSMKVLGEGDPGDTLVTLGVEPCIAVLYINRQNGRIGMAHIASAHDLGLLDEMQKQVQSSSGEDIEVLLWGGKKDRSEALGALIMDRVNNMEGVRLVGVNICDPYRGQINSIALSRTGKVQVETFEDMNMLLAPSQQEARQGPDEGFKKLMATLGRPPVRGVEPTSIQPDKDALKRGDIGIGRGKSDPKDGPPVDRPPPKDE